MPHLAQGCRARQRTGLMDSCKHSFKHTNKRAGEQATNKQHIHAHTHTHTNTDKNTHTQTHIHAHAHTHTNTHTHTVIFGKLLA